LKILGLYLAAGVYPKVNIYNMVNGSLVSETSSGSFFNTMDLVLLSSDLMAGANSDKNIRIWNLTTNNEKFLLKGHTDQVWGIKLISCDILASGSFDGTSRLWNITDGTLIRNLTGHSNSIYWSVDLYSEEILATGSYDQTIKLWNISTGEEVKTINTSLTGGIRSLTVLNSSTCIFFFILVY
jgi:WD40 repeat protein